MRVREEDVVDEGMEMSWSGLEKRASTCDAALERGERARFLMGRLERGSADVGIDSGMFSDIFNCFVTNSPCVCSCDATKDGGMERSLLMGKLK